MVSAAWEHWKFGLIVTGKGEEKGIAELFRSLSSTGLCSFKVIGRIGQRSPITSPKRKRKLKMVGSGKTIPDRDAETIGMPARKHLQAANGRFVIVLDDLEWDRHNQVQGVFERYRTALDTILLTDAERSRASVHFLVMMLEAYFFADSQATNQVLGLNLDDHLGDVEQIPHPKQELKRLCQDYNEMDHGPEIIGGLRVDHILARRECCAHLRALFNWCLAKLASHPFASTASLPPQYPGRVAAVTGNQ